jgi:hypothetical protein
MRREIHTVVAKVPKVLLSLTLHYQRLTEKLVPIFLNIFGPESYFLYKTAYLLSYIVIFLCANYFYGESFQDKMQTYIRNWFF